ncbi:HAD-IA family hydrolase [Kribbella sp. VKM Ac-2571]|uniref:HAD family hydrolase n=1 Tax=Kribbella sp. VKM Ac-2571 TaxID=2512222 RepID=UPI00105E38AA
MAETALLLDLDGTVWDSTPWYQDLANLSSDRVPSGLNAARLLRAKGYTEARLRRALRDGSPPALYAGVDESLDQLAEAGIRIGAVTNLPRWVAGPMLRGTGLLEYLDTTVDFGATRRHKPNPQPLLVALERLDCSPVDSWYVGDHADDAAAAAAAGMHFAWAAWGYGDVPPPTAERVLGAPSEIASLLLDPR